MCLPHSDALLHTIIYETGLEMVMMVTEMMVMVMMTMMMMMMMVMVLLSQQRVADCINVC